MTTAGDDTSTPQRPIDRPADRDAVVRDVVVVLVSFLVAASPVPASAREGIRHRMSLKMDTGGRVLIPSAVREAMGVAEGDTVLAWLEDGELHLVSPQVALRQAQELARKLMRGAGSLADELIAERSDTAKHADQPQEAGRKQNICLHVMASLRLNVSAAPLLDEFGH